MKVNTIYSGFMGETNCLGIGAPCTFVRFSGCNLRCYAPSLCDTPEALCINSGKDMEPGEIFYKVIDHGMPIVCLTGGEPLLQDNSEIEELLDLFVRSNIFVVVETNGSIPTMKIGRRRYSDYVSYVIDYKLKSTGIPNLKMLSENWENMSSADLIKFVIDDEGDYEEFKEWVGVNSGIKGSISVGLKWGSKLSYQDLFHRLGKDNLSSKVYLNMQTHKMSVLYDTYKDTVAELIIPKNL